jgi:hypothetical protein
LKNIGSFVEIGSVPNFNVDIELTDETPFYIRPYPISEGNKEVIDAELQKLLKLGIIAKCHKALTSPLLLVGK